MRWITAGHRAVDTAEERVSGKTSGSERGENECESNKGTTKKKRRREAGVGESPGLYCTSAHMGLPAAAVIVMITLTTIAITAAHGNRACCFSCLLSALLRARNHLQVTTDDATHYVYMKCNIFIRCVSLEIKSQA